MSDIVKTADTGWQNEVRYNAGVYGNHDYSHSGDRAGATSAENLDGDDVGALGNTELRASSSTTVPKSQKRMSREGACNLRAVSTVSIAIAGATNKGSTPAGTTTELVVGGEDTSVDDIDIDTVSGAVVVGVRVGQSATTTPNVSEISTDSNRIGAYVVSWLERRPVWLIRPKPQGALVWVAVVCMRPSSVMDSTSSEARRVLRVSSSKVAAGWKYELRDNDEKMINTHRQYPR